MSPNTQETKAGSREYHVENWSKIILKSCYEAFNKEEGCDLQLHCNEEIIKVHKNILRAASGYIRNLPLSQVEVILPSEISVQTLKQIITFVYTGKVQIKDKERKVFSSGAKILDIPIIVQLTEKTDTLIHNSKSGVRSYSNQTSRKSDVAVKPIATPVESLPAIKILKDAKPQGPSEWLFHRKIQLDNAHPGCADLNEDIDDDISLTDITLYKGIGYGDMPPRHTTDYSELLDLQIPAQSSTDFNETIPPCGLWAFDIDKTSQPLPIIISHTISLGPKEEEEEIEVLEEEVSIEELKNKLRSESWYHTPNGKVSCYPSPSKNPIQNNATDSAPDAEAVAPCELITVRESGFRTNDESEQSIISFAIESDSDCDQLTKPSDYTDVSSSDDKNFKISVNCQRRLEKTMLDSWNDSPEMKPTRIIFTTDKATGAKKIVPDDPDLLERIKNKGATVMKAYISKQNMKNTTEVINDILKNLPDMTQPAKKSAQKRKLQDDAQEIEHGACENQDDSSRVSKTYACDRCPSISFQSYYNLKQHRVSMHCETEDLGTCEFCGFKSVKRNIIYHHLYTKHGVEPPPSVKFYPCEFCPYVGISETFINKHLRSHPESYRTFTCSCGVTSESVVEIYKHLKSCEICRQNKRYDCFICREIFDRFVNFKAHLRTDHKDQHEKIVEEEQSFLENPDDPEFDEEKSFLSMLGVSDFAGNVSLERNDVDVFQNTSQLQRRESVEYIVPDNMEGAKLSERFLEENIKVEMVSTLIPDDANSG